MQQMLLASGLFQTMLLGFNATVDDQIQAAYGIYTAPKVCLLVTSNRFTNLFLMSLGFQVENDNKLWWVKK